MKPDAGASGASAAARAGRARERAALSTAVLSALKGSALPASGHGPGDATTDGKSTSGLTAEPIAALEERADAGDIAAERELRLRRRLESVPRRAARALALETVDVVLADGSSLSLDEAERLLANKEDQRVHAALRRAVDDAQDSLRHFVRYGSDGATRALSKQFLVDTAPLAPAALEALAALGGVPVEDARSLARALDLPDAQGVFGEDTTRALATVFRAALRAPPHAMRAPRAMAGAALQGRYAWPTGLRRCGRHQRTLEALGTAAATAFEQSPGNADAAFTAEELGHVAAFALSSTAVRQAAGMERRLAERAARICAASVVLRARASIALAALPEDAHVDEAREVVISALGVDPGRALLMELATPSWATVDDELPRAFLHAPLHALALRDAFDETWVLRRDAWDAIEHGDVVESVDASAKDVVTKLASAWKTWAGEWL